MTWSDYKYFGYGLLGMTPDELFKATPVELFDMVEAYYTRRDNEIRDYMSILAWQTSHIMNSSGNYKSAIKPEQLYNPDSDDENSGELTPIDREEKNEKLNALKEQFGIQADR